jgi:hypothetical protein
VRCLLLRIFLRRSAAIEGLGPEPGEAISADANQEGKRAKPRGISELSIFLRSSSAVALGITFLVQGLNAGLARRLTILVFQRSGTCSYSPPL